MSLSTYDWYIIIAFFAISLGIGLYASRRAGKNTTEFFLGGRDMPWWLLGVSMVATTFSADTPNLVTDIVRKNGIAGNWEWWAFLLTGMLTVFVYARMWRRSGVLTDLEFYEMRYSGGAATFLRGFRAIYLGVLFNVMVMASVCLAAIKIGNVMLGLSPIETLVVSSIFTVIYSMFGGLRGIILTDFFQFFLAMIGTIWAAVVILNLPEIGGLDQLLQNATVQSKMDLVPDGSNYELLMSVLIVPLLVQWWAAYYPGAEPGGGGYIAQRMLAAKNERHAMGATMLFNIAHYALRPWPWILIALASLVVFPDLDAISSRFPNVSQDILNDDLAYPAMLTFLPEGLLGIVVASLIAAFMSTISTHLNWGSSYITHDYYRRFVNPRATEKQLVKVGRIVTVLLMIASGILALYLDSALQAFKFIIMVGAGTGLIFILRWFWWRINAYSEIAGMILSFVVAWFLEFGMEDMGMAPLPGYLKLPIGVAVTTIGWVTVTLLTPPTTMPRLISFYRQIKPPAIGWQPVIKIGTKGNHIPEVNPGMGQLPRQLLGMLLGCAAVYSALFATGFWLFGNTNMGLAFTAITIVCTTLIFVIWKQLIR